MKFLFILFLFISVNSCAQQQAPDSIQKLFTVRDLVVIMDQVRERVKDKMTLQEWDMIIAYLNRMIEIKRKELPKKTK